MASPVAEGTPDGKGLRLAIVVSRFNESVTERLLVGARAEVKRCQLADDQVDIFRVPGAFEIPVLVARLVRTKNYQAVACLGAVVRGETPHFDYVCRAALEGIAVLSRESGIPITSGIVTADNLEQAMARSEPEGRNLGVYAVRAALEMANLLKRIPL